MRKLQHTKQAITQLLQIIIVIILIGAWGTCSDCRMRISAYCSMLSSRDIPVAIFISFTTALPAPSSLASYLSGILPKERHEPSTLLNVVRGFLDGWDGCLFDDTEEVEKGEKQVAGRRYACRHSAL